MRVTQQMGVIREPLEGDLTNSMSMENEKHHITVKDLTMAYGDFVVMHDLSFVVNRAEP